MMLGDAENQLTVVRVLSFAKWQTNRPRVLHRMLRAWNRHGGRTGRQNLGLRKAPQIRREDAIPIEQARGRANAVKQPHDPPIAGTLGTQVGGCWRVRHHGGKIRMLLESWQVFV